jgi:hypothetical protein
VTSLELRARLGLQRYTSLARTEASLSASSFAALNSAPSFVKRRDGRRAPRRAHRPRTFMTEALHMLLLSGEQPRADMALRVRLACSGVGSDWGAVLGKGLVEVLAFVGGEVRCATPAEARRRPGRRG